MRDTPANDLQAAARVAPRHDAVGAAADYLRGYLCNAMATPEGRMRWMPWFAHLAGRANAPGGAGRSEHDYIAHVRGLRDTVFADQLNLVQIAEALGVCIQVVPCTPADAARQWAITTISPHNVGRSILLVNDNLHYVWLRPLDPELRQ